MDPETLNPDDTLAALGLTTDEAAPGAGYQMPATDPETGLPTQMTKPGEALPPGQRNGPLEQARVLATLAGRGSGQASGMDRFAAGVGAKTGKAPQNKLAAALDGGLSGFAAAYGAGKSKKGGLSDIKERMGMLKTLFDMDRSLARDRASQDYRDRSLAIAEKRVNQGGKGGGDPLLREARITSILSKHPAKLALDEDDALPPGSRAKLSPEARKDLEGRVAAERQRLEALGGVPIANDIVPPPATPSPQQKPAPVDSAPPSVKPAPTATVDAAPTPASPKKSAPTGAPKAPTLTREQVIEQGRAANQRGVPLEAIIGRAKENGFDLKTDDFLKSQQPAPAPQQSNSPSMPATDPMGNVVGPQSSVSPENIMGLLASLLG